MLAAGTKLGPYEVLSSLGSGGMGEVYRARDTRLDRTVAIKVLASDLCSSPELKQRMEREARAISSLNHPHICQLYDIGSQDGVDFLVMEFLAGETLADRLRQGALPLPEVFKIGIAIAEALAVAHRQGIVHRDLKPGNIMLTDSGAKLMDFGLAKPVSMPAAASSSTSAPAFTAAATISEASPLSPLTSVGSIVGTIQYMSPEQIAGKEIDARSDIFALGAVLYEMATGKRAFSGKSQISVASLILDGDPEPISSLKPLAPPAFEHVISTCLQKNPEQRFQTAHDIKLELEWIASGRSSPAVQPQSRGRERYAWIGGLIIVMLLGVVIGGLFRPPAQKPQIVRSVINPPPNSAFNLIGDFAGSPVLSPDGSAIAFTANGPGGKTNLWVRSVDQIEARMLSGTDGATHPFWSPDSRSIGFFADEKVKTIDTSSDSASALAEARNGRGGSWGPGGVILFSPNIQSPIMRVNASGGPAVPVTTIDIKQHTSHRFPFSLPDGKHFLYIAIHHDPSKSANNGVFYASLDGHENRLLFHAQSNAIFAGGYLLFARGDQFMAQRFDPATGSLTGDPQTLAKGVVNDVTTWHMDASASDNGLLVLGNGTAADIQLAWLDREGKELSVLPDKFSNLGEVRISPQGDRIALHLDTGQNDVWVLDLARDVRSRLTFGPVNVSPIWSPDGKWIAYAALRSATEHDVVRKPADGSGAEEILLTDEQELRVDDWSRNGKYLLYTRGGGENWEIRALPLEGERKSFLVAQHGPNSQGVNASFSPDGHWVAYNSVESGEEQVYVSAFGGGQGKWQVSPNGGVHPRWTGDGKDLFYLDGSFALMDVPVAESAGTLKFGPPRPVIRNWSAPNVFYDISPDGQRVLLPRVSQQINQSVTLVTNFTADLKK